MLILRSEQFYVIVNVKCKFRFRNTTIKIFKDFLEDHKLQHTFVIKGGHRIMFL